MAGCGTGSRSCILPEVAHPQDTRSRTPPQPHRRGKEKSMSENTVTKGLIDDLNRRVADLEQELAALKRQVEAGPVKDWRSTVGMFTGDDVMKAIFEEG